METGQRHINQELDLDSLVPEKLKTPQGETFLTLEARGYQIFRCKSDTKGTYWKFERPAANLYDSLGQKVATLEGPMSAFEYKDGSRIIAAHITAWVQTATPQQDIPNALMQAISDPGDGMFNNVTYIQRLKSKGGKPSKGCSPDEIGHIIKIPFTAEYVFWK